jgi:phage-related protein
MTKKEVNEFLKKEFNKKSIDWKTPTYYKPYVCSCEILTETSRPCPYYSCYLFEKEI